MHPTVRRDAITRLSYHRAAQVAPDGPRISRFLLNPLVPHDTLRNPRARTALYPREHPTVGIYTRYSAAGSTLIAEAPVSASPDPIHLSSIGSGRSAGCACPAPFVASRARLKARRFGTASHGWQPWLANDDDVVRREESGLAAPWRTRVADPPVGPPRHPLPRYAGRVGRLVTTRHGTSIGVHKLCYYAH